MGRKVIKYDRGEIFDYWKDVCIDYQGHIHYEGDYPIDKSIPVVIDWEEQHCFGCGRRIKSNNPHYKKWIKDENYKAIWNDYSVDTELQKSHIIADSLGGDPKPRNLFLLCPQCHFDSPDTSSETMFFKWIYDKRKSKEGCDTYYKDALKILKDYNIAHPVMNELDNLIKPGVNITGQKNGYKTTVVDSSYVSLLVDDALKNRSGLNKKAERTFEGKVIKRISELISYNPNDEKIQIYKEIIGWYWEAKKLEETDEFKRL